MHTYTCLIFGIHHTCLHAESIAADEVEIQDAAEFVAASWPDAIGYEVWLQGRKVISHFGPAFDDSLARRILSSPSSSLALSSRGLGDHMTSGKR